MRLHSEQRVVHCENGDISYLLNRKPVKNINMRIKPEGNIYVSANNNVPIEYLDAFIVKNQQYIFSVLAKFEEKRKQIQDAPKRYVSGERFHFLGNC